MAARIVTQIFFLSNFSDALGFPSQTRDILPKVCFPCVSKDIPNFLDPTPPRGRAPPHRNIPRPKSLSLCSLLLFCPIPIPVLASLAGPSKALQAKVGFSEGNKEVEYPPPAKSINPASIAEPWGEHIDIHAAHEVLLLCCQFSAAGKWFLRFSVTPPPPRENITKIIRLE